MRFFLECYMSIVEWKVEIFALTDFYRPYLYYIYGYISKERLRLSLFSYFLSFFNHAYNSVLSVYFVHFKSSPIHDLTMKRYVKDILDIYIQQNIYITRKCKENGGRGWWNIVEYYRMHAKKLHANVEENRNIYF